MKPVYEVELVVSRQCPYCAHYMAQLRSIAADFRGRADFSIVDGTDPEVAPYAAYTPFVSILNRRTQGRAIFPPPKKFEFVEDQLYDFVKELTH